MRRARGRPCARTTGRVDLGGVVRSLAGESARGDKHSLPRRAAEQHSAYTFARFGGCPICESGRGSVDEGVNEGRVGVKAVVGGPGNHAQHSCLVGIGCHCLLGFQLVDDSIQFRVVE